MTIHKEGFSTIALASALLIISVIVMELYFAEDGMARWIVYGPMIVFWFLILQFFRVPKRKIQYDAAQVLSPADGRVVVVEETIEKEYFKTPMLQVSIFMSPVNVHQNRYPVTGRVIYHRYHPGKYLLAWNPKSSELNERTSIAFETAGNKKIMMHQVAGFLARRIVCYSHEGDQVKQGDELGFIKFGSRCDLYLPLNAKIEVKIGDKVKGGISPIAYLEKA